MCKFSIISFAVLAGAVQASVLDRVQAFLLHCRWTHPKSSKHSEPGDVLSGRDGFASGRHPSDKHSVPVEHLSRAGTFILETNLQ